MNPGVAFERTEPRPTCRLGAAAQWLSAAIAASCLFVGAASASEALHALDGMLEPDMMVDVASPVPGVVEDVHVDRSDVVTQGQVVARLQDSVQQAQLKVAQTRAQLSGEIRAREASKVFAERRQARTDQLWEKRVIPLDDRDEAEARARVAAEDVNAAREKRKIASVELSLAEEEVEQRIIRSPIDGVVVDRFVQPGNRVDEQSIVRIARIDPLRVEVVVPYDYFDAIKTGMQAKIEPELPVEGEFVATVTRVDRVIDAASGTFTIRLSLPNPDGRLPSGLKCKVVFPDGLAKVYQRQDDFSNIAVAPAPTVTPPAQAPAATEPADAPMSSGDLPPASAEATPVTAPTPVSEAGTPASPTPAQAPESEASTSGVDNGLTGQLHTVKTVLGYALGDLRDRINRQRDDSEQRREDSIEAAGASTSYRQALQKRRQLREAREFRD